MSKALPLLRRIALASALLLSAIAHAAEASAQDLTPSTEPPITDSAPETSGILIEPGVLHRIAVILDRRYNSGEVIQGPYAVIGKMIPGAGWISAGPGYRRWYAEDRVFVDTSAALSWRGYKTAQGRFELPRLAKSRLLVGAQARWQDFTQVAYFGQGPGSLESNRSQYAIQSKIFGAYATVRPIRALAIDAQAGWLQPDISAPRGLFKSHSPYVGEQFRSDPVFAVGEQPTFLQRGASITLDTRDFPGHPTAGAVYRAAFADFSDRGTAAFNFKQYEGEAARFIGVRDTGVIVAVRGWVASTVPSEGQTVPFYLQPSLGGLNTLRGYTDYRFHDRNLLLVNAEVRVPVLTHVDGALFVDAGNVAPRLSDLDLAKRSYGVGVRLHSRRQTFARVDVAHGSEGWMFLVRLSEPLDLSRLTRQTVMAPFVP